MTWINPYKARITRFPGRLFPFEEFARERDEVQALLQSEQCYCEIGSGSGIHAIELARQEPKARVFGFEIRYKRAVRTIEKAERLNVPNVYVFRTKGEYVAEIFPAGSLDGLFVHFPDPWDKGRWHKHRILGSPLLEKAARLLKRNGFLQIKTDHREYFDTFMAEVRADSRFAVGPFTVDLYASEYLEENIPSEFEKLFRDKRQAICYARLTLN